MRRCRVLSATILVGCAMTMTVAGFQPPAQGVPKLRLQLLNPSIGMYVLIGAGGNTVVFEREEGVVIVDSKLPGSGRSIIAAVESITSKPVTTIINTHGHADHAGGNGELPGVTEIVAHQRAAARMQQAGAPDGAEKRAATTIVRDRLSLFEGPDRIDLYYFGAGHTDGDLVVVFPAAGIVHMGDLFPAKAAPVIDPSNGGSGVAFPATLARAVAEIKGVRSVSTGHDDPGYEPPRSSATASTLRPYLMTWSDLQEYAEFNQDFLEAVRRAFAAGRSPDEAAATLMLPDRYKNYDMRQARANVGIIYAELQGKDTFKARLTPVPVDAVTRPTTLGSAH